MVAVFPTWLPSPTVEGASETRQDPRRSRAGEAGPPRFARRFSAVSRPVRLTFVLKPEEFFALDAFYFDDLKHGSLPFKMPDPFRDGRPMFDTFGNPVLDESGTQLLVVHEALCLMSSPPTSEALSDRVFRTRFPIVVMP